MTTENKPTVKKRISPVKVTVELTVNKINSNGTFSGVEILSVTSEGKANGNIYATSHNASGGSIWIKGTTLKGLEVISDAGANAIKKQPIKLF